MNANFQDAIDRGEIELEYRYTLETKEQTNQMALNVEKYIAKSIGYEFYTLPHVSEGEVSIFAKGINNNYTVNTFDVRGCFIRIRDELKSNNIPRERWRSLLLDPMYNYARDVIINTEISKTKLTYHALIAMYPIKARDINHYQKRHTINLFKENSKL